MNDIVEQFKQSLDKDYSEVYNRAIHIGLEHPEAINEMLYLLLIERPRGSTMFDDLFSYLPIQNYPEIIQHALTILRKNPEHEAAQMAIAKASLQVLPMLHPHLDTIFEVEPNIGTYYADNPWRESGLQHINFLTRCAADEAQSHKRRVRACEKLLETRQSTALLFVESIAPALNLDFEMHLRDVGCHKQGDSFKALFTEQPFHLIFPPAYLASVERPFWRACHPTWHLPTQNMPPQRFGGTLDESCAICGNHLHHLITLKPIPSALKIHRLPALTLATCLSCLVWSEPFLFYEHDGEGKPRNIGYMGAPSAPQFPASPLQETTVHLVDGGARWHWQEVGIANHRENLHRVGGHPSWVQDAQYPLCVHCNQPMRFLIQLDSQLPAQNGCEWLWGSGGLGYGYWCDACHVSAYTWQCT